MQSLLVIVPEHKVHCLWSGCEPLVLCAAAPVILDIGDHLLVSWRHVGVSPCTASRLGQVTRVKVTKLQIMIESWDEVFDEFSSEVVEGLSAVHLAFEAKCEMVGNRTLEVWIPSHIKWLVTIYSANLLGQKIFLQRLLHGLSHQLPFIGPVMVRSPKVSLDVFLLLEVQD